MATTMMGYIGIIRVHKGGVYKDHGKENGDYNDGLYRDYRVYVGGNIGIMEKNMATTT